jgi:hypothetical protein
MNPNKHLNDPHVLYRPAFVLLVFAVRQELSWQVAVLEVLGAVGLCAGTCKAVVAVALQSCQAGRCGVTGLSSIVAASIYGMYQGASSPVL